jgi:hypothetical protein
LGLPELLHPKMVTLSTPETNQHFRSSFTHHLRVLGAQLRERAPSVRE